jgi:sugar (pentulose or hexulose) kinase
MSKQILLGIDFGTTVLKVCALDKRKGSLLAHAIRRLPVVSLPHGGREQKSGDIDRAFKSAMTELKNKIRSDWRNIEGIGLAAQGGSTMIANRISGKALTPMILWDDGRTHDFQARLLQEYPPVFWRKHILCDSPPAGLGRLLWLKECRPDLFHDGNIHIGAGEYLFHKLTGLWRQDAGNAIQIGSYNPQKKLLFSTLFNIAEIPLSFVAPLRQGHETVSLSQKGAKRFDLPEDIRIAGPYIDQETGYLSTGGISTHPLQCSLGTAWVGNFVLPHGSNGKSPTQIVIPSPLDEGWLVIQPLLTGNRTWEWGLQQLVDEDYSQALEKARWLFRASILPKDDLFFLSWLDQPNPLNPQSIGAGVFHGLNTQTSRADMLRALVAGMCCELARVFDEVKQNKVIDSVVLGGGASNGHAFRVMIAALFSPLTVYQQKDIDLSTARGSVYALAPAIARTKTKRIIPPLNKLNAIQTYYQKYMQIFNAYYRSIPAGKAFQLGRIRL